MPVLCAVREQRGCDACIGCSKIDRCEYMQGAVYPKNMKTSGVTANDVLVAALYQRVAAKGTRCRRER